MEKVDIETGEIINDEQSTGRITIDDVVAAIADDDVFTTNASKIRAILGRGSNATIQKHLDALRLDKIKAAQPVETFTLPQAPKDLIDQIWQAAWRAAQQDTLVRIDKITTERDNLKVILGAQNCDVESLTIKIDELEIALDASASDLQDAQASFAADVDVLLVDKTALLTQIDALQNTIDDLIKKGEQDTKTVLLERQIEQQAVQLERAGLQMTIDRLTDQIGDLKSFNRADK